MRVYKTQHQYYCGVDLHARSLFVNVLDDRGTTRFEQDLPANPAAFLDARCGGVPDPDALDWPPSRTRLTTHRFGDTCDH